MNELVPNNLSNLMILQKMWITVFLLSIYLLLWMTKINMKERKGNENSELSSVILVSTKEGGKNKYSILLVISNWQYVWNSVWMTVEMHDLILF